MEQQNNNTLKDFINAHFPGLEKETWYPVIFTIAEEWALHQMQQLNEKNFDLIKENKYLQADKQYFMNSYNQLYTKFSSRDAYIDKLQNNQKTDDWNEPGY